jgi:hypothetical protein
VRATPRSCRSSSVIGRLLAAAILLAGGSARAEWTAQLVVNGEDAAHTGPVHARVGEEVEVRVVLRAPDRRVLADVPRVDGRRVDAPFPHDAQVRWWRVQPRFQVYSNVVQWGVFEGDWRGIEPLHYVERPLEPNGEIAIEGAVLRMRGRGDGPGTTWIAAEVVLADGTRVRTPGASSTDTHGIARDVLRISYRAGDDFLGWLASYFGVPFVFGSVARQVDRYNGADCADVLVGAHRAMGRPMRYVSVAGISRYARATSDVLLVGRDGSMHAEDGSPVRLAWGSDVASGDLVAIDYGTLGRPWDHIGALVSDDGDGVLDGGDLLRNMTLYGLADRPLAEQDAARVRLWRWRRNAERSRSTARSAARSR